MPARREQPGTPVRMKDIAKDLGLSVVTVSKVFRGHRDIGDETRQRVLKRLTELNYKPNLAARSLATGRSFTMGFVMPDLVHPFFAEIAKHLSGVLRSKGYHLLMASSEEDEDLERQQVEYLLARGVDVLLLACCQHDPALVTDLKSRRIPLILVDRKFSGFANHFVGVDDNLAGTLATRHLLEQGCRLIAHISSRFASTSVGRLEGYRMALRAAGLPLRPQYCIARVHGDDTADETGYEAMRRLLRLDPKPDGVFCNNDPTAMGAMRAILEAGLKIPRDIAVVGCGNIRYADFLRVPLTTIDQNCEGIGKETGKLALGVLNSGSNRIRTVLLEPQLIVRESSLRMKRIATFKTRNIHK